MRRISAFFARLFARFVGRTSDERLSRLMRGLPRRLVLGAIFWQMPRHLDRREAEGLDAKIGFKIRGADGNGRADRVDRYLVTIADGRCRVSRDDEPARVTVDVDGVDFLRLATGNAEGPTLFMSGRLQLEGDLMFAARATQLFRIPTARP